MRNSKLSLALFLVALFVAPLSAQRLASYDVQSGGAELAGRRCPPMAPAAFTAPLQHPAPAGLQWFHGAIAAANQTQRLYWCNGPAGQGILRLAFSLIGTGVAPVSFPIPPVFNQVTGMVADPSDPQGRNLYVTDGNAVCLYRAPGGAAPAAMVAGPWAWPGVGGGTQITGLTYDVFNNRVVAVDNASNRYRFNPNTLTWTGPVAPVGAVPAQATGIQICLVGGQHWVTYSNGVVMDPSTGMVIAFPAAPGGGIRHHQGLTYMGQAVWLGGGGPVGGLELNPVGGPWVGNQGFGFNVDPMGNGHVFMLIDVNGQANGVPAFGGIAYVDPQASHIIDLGSHDQPFLVPLPLPTSALGTTAVVQAAIMRQSGVIALSDAWEGQLYRLN